MPRYEVTLSPPARRELTGLPREVQRRIVDKLEALADDPRPVGVKALVNGGGRLRLRVGDYRVIYRVEDAHLVVLVITVGHRRDVYRA
jgi:mRNA interferase RelE/StbE